MDESVLYEAVASRRAHYDGLLWQVPVLSLTAQAFLFTLALGGGTPRLSRVLAALLSIVVTFLSVTLMARHRQAELADSHWLAEFEQVMKVPAPFRAHGAAWATRRDQVAVETGIWRRAVPLLRGYRTWVAGMYVFGAVAIVVLLVALVAPVAFT